ncbi:cRISPR-associated protein Csd1 family [Ruminococcus sp. CAG:403]|nr:cRISPR-associated protein Csd1 family [Ruminococcus sp. CAG:403]
MLIKALCDYSAAANLCGDIEAYYKQAIDFEILLALDGTVTAIQDLRKPIEGTKRYITPELLLPEQRGNTTVIYSYLIEHRREYIFGLEREKGKNSFKTIPGKAGKKSKHDTFCERNLPFFEEIDSDICKAYCNFIRTWNPDLQTENEILLQMGANFDNARFCFGLDGSPEIMLHEDPRVKENYQALLLEEQKEKQATQQTGFCSILGERLPICEMHDKLKGIGSQAKLVSFGKDQTDRNAFYSYGKSLGYNCNISEKAMKQYTAALNFLLADNGHHKNFGDMVVVYFAMKQNDTAECDAFSLLFGDFASDQKETVDQETEKDLNQVYNYAKTGVLKDLSGMDPDSIFYVAGLTANSSRICTKFVVRNRFGVILEHVAAHQKDIRILEKQKPVSMYWIQKQLVSPKSKDAKVPPPLIAGLFASILNGTRYPDALLATVIARVKTDTDETQQKKVNHIRAGLIKGCLNRKAKKEEITMSLNLDNTNQAYLCGRLFAVLEKIQQDASGGNLNRTIKDSYFSSACSKPATVFPKLIQLSQNHLKKVEYVLFYQKLCGDIIDQLEDAFPSTLSLDEQGKFIIGYYQQNKALYAKKEKQQETATDDSVAE